MIAASAQTDEHTFLWIIYCCAAHCKASLALVETFELRYLLHLHQTAGQRQDRSVCLLALRDN